MKHLKLIFVTVLLLYVVAASAETVVVNGVTYDVIKKVKEAKVIAGETKYTGDVVIPSIIEYDGGTYSVTSIGDYAFYDCSNLVSVEISNTIRNIGVSAFEDCKGLKEISIPESVVVVSKDAFAGCSGLGEIVIPGSVVSLGDGAFAGCTSLKSAIIPGMLQYVGSSSFSGCTALVDVIICDGISNVSNYMFDNCSQLENLTIGNGVASIGTCAFRNCMALKGVRIPGSVTEIAGEAFVDCWALESVVFENCAVVIGDNAFRRCVGLKDLFLGDSVEVIGVAAFSGCSLLESVVIPNSVVGVYSFAFSGCEKLKTLVIGSGVKRIESCAFEKCEELTDVYCLATDVPTTIVTAFNESYPEGMSLYVPECSIDAYKATAPWSYFGVITILDDDIEEPEVPALPQCATPVIGYEDGALVITCDTDGAQFVTTIVDSDIKTHYSGVIELSATYNITTYATKAGYDNSATVTATLCWVPVNGAGDTGVIEVEAVPVLVTAKEDVVAVRGGNNGATVAVYSLGGVYAGGTVIANGEASVAVDAERGTTLIVEVAGKGIKVVVQ